MVFDTQLGRAILYDGGAVVWNWDGSQWQSVQPAVSPPLRGAFGLAYDSQRNRAVLFGGWASGPGFLGDTWEWDGTSWAQRNSTPSPSPRQQLTLVYDSRRGRVVGYGGGDATSNYLTETWEWDGTTWLHAGPGPAYGGLTNPFLNWVGMGFDERRGRTVLLLGIAPSGSTQTWEWDGTTWLQRQPAHAPSNRGCSPLAFDRSRGRLVLKGGAYSGDDTWEWDGTDWIQRNPVALPTLRFFCHAMTGDATRGRVVAFTNGFSQSGTQYYDVWEYGPVYPAQYLPFGAGCAGSAGVPTLAPAPGELPWLGDTLTLRVTRVPTTTLALLFLGSSRTSFGGYPLPIDLTALGMPGCSLYTRGTVLLQATSQNGVASFTTPLPAATDLLGAPFFAQALVADPQANAAGLAATNALDARIGGR